MNKTSSQLLHTIAYHIEELDRSRKRFMAEKNKKMWAAWKGAIKFHEERANEAITQHKRMTESICSPIEQYRRLFRGGAK